MKFSLFQVYTPHVKDVETFFIMGVSLKWIGLLSSLISKSKLPLWCILAKYTTEGGGIFSGVAFL